jgi:hypothetical protein
MPDMAALAEARILSNAKKIIQATKLESPDPETAPAVIKREYGKTRTGIAAKGQLEERVNSICTFWALCEVKPVDHCTPAWIARIIADRDNIKEPSVGAIGAVFDRWSKIGYAVREYKPVRFTEFTALGKQLGLEGCKEKSRRERKSRA